MRKAILCIVTVLATAILVAQDYNTAVGARYSTIETRANLGFTIQQRITSNITLEGIYQRINDQNIATVLGEYHKKIFWKGLNIYAGAGANVNLSEVEVKDFNYGINAIAGFELRIPFVPIVFSWDVMPAITQSQNGTDVEFYGGTASVRIVIASDRMKKKRLKRQKQKLKQENREQKLENLKEKLPF